MEKKKIEIDRVFQALGDATRRAMMERLSSGPMSVSRLAEPYEMSLAAVLQHLQVLEEAGLVRTEKVGRVRSCRIGADGLDVAQRWLKMLRPEWEKRLDRLGDMFAEPEKGSS
jgi:DNA-binding transcriptional ArsR family regulator